MPVDNPATFAGNRSGIEGGARPGVHKADVSDMMRRLTKEELYRFDGTPLFPNSLLALGGLPAILRYRATLPQGAEGRYVFQMALGLRFIRDATQYGGCSSQSEWPVREQPPTGSVMLILRGVANSEKPHGLLDDRAALEYARRLGFRGEVLDLRAIPVLTAQHKFSLSDFIGVSEVVIKPDPPEGHMTGPKALLESLRTESSLQ